MTQEKIKKYLKQTGGNLTSKDKVFEGQGYQYVAAFDSVSAYDDFSDITGLGGPTDFINGIFHVWFNGEE